LGTLGIERGALSREAAAFWLDVHAHLRRDAAGVAAASADYRRSPAELAVVAAPRLRGLIAAMQGHHQIEDFHYFPAFRRAEPQLAPAFDRLEREHESLSFSVSAALAALDELHATVQHLAAEPAASSTQELAAQRYVDAAAALCRELERHLHEEESVVVPLLHKGDY
jgi:iron-sulfur cluster repair protein YtfE (RIC family)